MQPRECKQSSAQHLVETGEILQDYAQYCKEELNLSTDEIHAILSDHLAHLARFGIPPWQAEAICMTYQEQLERCLLFTSSTVVRNLLCPSFGAFRETLLPESGIGLVCLKCKKPINRPDKKCDSCGHRPDPCPICWQKYSPYTVTKRARKLEEMKIPAFKMPKGHGVMESILPADHPASRVFKKVPQNEKRDDSQPRLVFPVLWQFCLSCGHGAHAACLQHQQAIPELGGRCPIGGCGCACIPGPYRDRMIREAEEEEKKGETRYCKGRPKERWREWCCEEC